jgi:hypothetical protein
MNSSAHNEHNARPQKEHPRAFTMNLVEQTSRQLLSNKVLGLLQAGAKIITSRILRAGVFEGFSVRFSAGCSVQGWVS